ncbi:MAG: XRE family transcriptional regulator [Clostridia bacterium]|nr:XRE family transcriptional regulator [Clostridia bacterium]
MDIPTKIKLSEAYAKISEAELARRLGKTSQSFGQRLKTGKFTSSELETIADALGAKFECNFVFPDGTKI